MYYQNYEDYIRSILGYPVMANNQYVSNSNNSTNTNTYNYEYITNRPTYNQEILNLYPDIYKILNPMICKICEANTKPITRELVDQMTDEIYLNIESDNLNTELNTTNIRVNVQKDNSDNKVNNSTNNINSNNTNNRKRQSDNLVEKGKEKNREENRENNVKESENRQIRSPRNPMLRDLIKILILNQLLFGNSRPRPRPRQHYQDNLFNQIQPQIPRDNRYYNNYLN